MFAESRGAEPVPAASVQRVTFEEYRAAIQRVKPGAVLLSRADIEHVKYILENPDAPEPSGSPEHVKRVKNWREFMRGKYTLREVPDPTDNLTAEELAMPNPRPRRKLRLVVEKQVDNRLKRGNSGDAPPLGRELVCDEDIFICIQREHLESGHKGGTGVYNNAKQRYAIPRYLVRIYVKICPVCKLKNKRRQPDGILHPIKAMESHNSMKFVNGHKMTPIEAMTGRRPSRRPLGIEPPSDPTRPHDVPCRHAGGGGGGAPPLGEGVEAPPEGSRGSPKLAADPGASRSRTTYSAATGRGGQRRGRGPLALEEGDSKR
eukprot:tig00000219_g19518.t1